MYKRQAQAREQLRLLDQADQRGAMRMYQLARTSLQPTDARARALEAVTRIHGLERSLDALEAPASEVVAAVAP